MMKSFAVLGFLLAGLSAPLAQDAAPTIEIDPAAPINSMPKHANLLTGLYATQAVIDICAITVPEPVMTAMNFDRKRYENLLTMDEAASTRAYRDTKAEVERTAPDCAEGSPDRQGVEAVLSIYRTK